MFFFILSKMKVYVGSFGSYCLKKKVKKLYLFSMFIHNLNKKEKIIYNTTAIIHHNLLFALILN